MKHIFSEISETAGGILASPVRSPSAALTDLQHDAYNFWRSGEDEGHPPHRAHLRPERIREILPVSSLVEPRVKGTDLVFRHIIEGAETQRVFGCAEGRDFAEVYAADYADNLRRIYRRVALGAMVDFAEDLLFQQDGEAIRFTRLLLPFVDRRFRVVRILTVFGFETVPESRAPSHLFDSEHAARIAADAISPLRKPRFREGRRSHVA